MRPNKPSLPWENYWAHVVKDVVKNHLSSNLQTVVAALKERMDEQAQIIKTITEESEGHRTQVTMLTEESRKRMNDIEKLETQTEEKAHAINRLESKTKKLEIKSGELKEDLNALTKALEEEKKERMDDVASLGQVIYMLMPLHLRVLLDLASQKFLEDLNVDSWEALRGDRTTHELKQHIWGSLPPSARPSLDTVDYVCAYKHVRREGSAATHTLTKEDVREAVLQEPPEDRRCLEEVFLYAYGDHV